MKKSNKKVVTLKQKIDDKIYKVAPKSKKITKKLETKQQTILQKL